MTVTTRHPKVADVLEALREGFDLPDATEPLPTDNAYGGVDMRTGEGWVVRMYPDDNLVRVVVLTHQSLVPIMGASFTDTTASDAIAAFVAYYLT